MGCAHQEDKDGTPIAKTAAAARRRLRRLLHFHEIEEWRKDNEWIVTGYRVSDGSYWSCVESLLYWHNETGNIYSHLLGAIVSVAVAVYTFSVVVTDSFMDQLIFSCFFFGAVVCLSLSATFHTLCSHSFPVSKTWNKCDYVGITFMIVGSCYPAIYYSFNCNAFEQLLYLVLISTLGMATLPVILLDRFSDKEWRIFRAVLYVGLGISGIVPMFHIFFTHGYDYAMDGAALDWMLAMGIFYIAGAFLYGARIPERHFPGKFDYWLHSHQIFHYCVIIAAWLHYQGLLEAYTWHKQNECTATCMYMEWDGL